MKKKLQLQTDTWWSLPTTPTCNSVRFYHFCKGGLLFYNTTPTPSRVAKIKTDHLISRLSATQKTSLPEEPTASFEEVCQCLWLMELKCKRNVCYSALLLNVAKILWMTDGSLTRSPQKMAYINSESKFFFACVVTQANMPIIDIF